MFRYFQIGINEQRFKYQTFVYVLVIIDPLGFRDHGKRTEITELDLGNEYSN